LGNGNPASLLGPIIDRLMDDSFKPTLIVWPGFSERPAAKRPLLFGPNGDPIRPARTCSPLPINSIICGDALALYGAHGLIVAEPPEVLPPLAGCLLVELRNDTRVVSEAQLNWLARPGSRSGQGS
jgi:hypothetical protein